MKSNDYKGDFLAIWMRKDIEEKLTEIFTQNWINKTSTKLLAFKPNLPVIKLIEHDYSKFSTFFRSDHANFWYNSYDIPLEAVLLTDMGKHYIYFPQNFH